MIKILQFNPFQVNTYVIADDANACVIIDPACETAAEEQQLLNFILENNLKVEHIVLTHFHIDHVMGTAFACKTFNLPLEMHKAPEMLIQYRKDSASFVGLAHKELPENIVYVKQGDIIKFGHSELEVRYTPGHADGSICLVWHAEKNVFTGDVMFYQSIGRTDLITGDYDLLKKSIHEQLFTLPDDYTVRAGHGPRTTIGYEKETNPFL